MAREGTRGRNRTDTAPGRIVLALLLGAAGLAGSPGDRAVAQTRAQFVPTFSTSTRIKQQLDRLQRLAAQKQWDPWIATYQQLVDDPKDPVVSRDDEFFVGVRYLSHQLLAGQPAVTRQRYRALHDTEARRLYDQAAAKNDAAGMREVYSRYRFTSSGPAALQWIAANALDSGQPELARVAYSRLAKEPAVTPGILLRYALAAGAAGKAAEAEEALNRVRQRFAGQPLQLAGQQLTGREAADQVAGQLRKLQPAPGNWTAFAGPAQDRRMGAGPLDPRRRWQFIQPTSSGTPSYRVYDRVQFNSYYSTRSRFSFLTFPAAAGDLVYVQGPRNVTALWLEDGKPAWDQQDFLLQREELPSDNPNPRTGGVYFSSGRPVQAAPSVEGHLVISRVPLSAGEREGGRWPIDHGIFAFDARTGQVLWRRLAGGDPRGLYFNIPTVRSNTVLTGIAAHKGGITEYTAQALDAGSGEVLWSTYLGAGSEALGAVDGSPAAVRDGLVWIESSLYTLNALDLLTGEIRCIYRYDPGRRTLGRGGMDNSPQVPNEPISLVGAGGGPVVFCPRWGVDVVAIDPATGKLLWSSPKAPGQSSVGALFAVDDRRAYICGDHVQAINLTDGSREWTWEPEAASGTVGYAALLDDRVYVPVDRRLYVRSAADGKELAVIDLEKEIPEGSGMLTVVAAGQKLLVSARDRVLLLVP